MLCYMYFNLSRNIWAMFATILDFKLLFLAKFAAMTSFSVISFVLQRLWFLSAEVLRLFDYQCWNTEEFNRMWETCKISIGKRCQNLRMKGKDGPRAD